MAKNLNVKIMGDDPIKLPKGTSLYELSKNYQHRLRYPILLARVNHVLMDLSNSVLEDCAVEFLDITNINGYRTYQRSLVFLLVCAAKETFGKKTRVVVEHSINKNYYCEIFGKGIEATDKTIKKIKDKMVELVEQDLPIEKHHLHIEDARKYATEFGLADKVEILKYRRNSTVNFYKLKGFYDYFYGQMAPSTGYLTTFDLIKSDVGFILQFPSQTEPETLSELRAVKKLSAVFRESNSWARILRVDTVGALNQKICNDQFAQLIRVAEALHEKKIAYLADEVVERKKNIVLIAGPSSSGKTTFANRLCIQMRANGLNPSVISLDNYFFNRDDAPIGADGLPDLENFGFMDVEQLNKDLKALLKGETVEIPHYNFHSGKREYKGHFMKMGEGDVLVLEGIHALNNELTYAVPKSKKFRIFISALTQLNVDDHNRIPTTDTRLIRRIVRDHLFRGTTAETTIRQWPSVVHGEAVNIFPFQEEADAFFNSALIYEMCIMKQFVEPLLFSIDRDKPEYTEARRIIKFLDSFMGMSSEQIQANSIMREFIGGSCFNT